MATIQSIVRLPDREDAINWMVCCDRGEQFMARVGSDGNKQTITIWWRYMETANWTMIYKPRVITSSALIKIVGVVQDHYNEEP